MKNLLIFIILISIHGCTTYSAGDIDGKWECTTEYTNIQLWISDTLAIGFNIDNQIMNTYKVDYDGRILTFNFIDHMEGSASWSVKILTFTNNEFKTKLQYPGEEQITTYRRISKLTGEISDNYETNWYRYEGYMRGRLDSLIEVAN